MNLSFAKFCELAKTHNLIPLYQSMPSDLDTPVSAFLKIRSGDYDFLLESVVGGEKWGRYSFIGTAPRKVFTFENGEFKITLPGGKTTSEKTSAPLSILKREMGGCHSYQDADLPRFFGGAVGYLAYDMVRYFDKIRFTKKAAAGVPDMVLMLTDTVVIFDNFQQLIKIVSVVLLEERARGDKKALQHHYDAATSAIKKVRERLSMSLAGSGTSVPKSPALEFTQVPDTAAFEEMVRTAKRYIEAGDIFQVVPSLRLTAKRDGIDPLAVYRALRRINPSPYMYCLKLGELEIVGASPEVLVRVEDGRVAVRPIAGTRKRGHDEAQDQILEAELRADPKERAEHIMLVDLGRNDVGRVANIGSVAVNDLEVVERYSHVMHLVSHVSGKLAKGKDVFDVIRAAFPAGTLSGAPKIRAMEIIDELEPESRGIYGGAIGYVSYSGNADLAIAIRTAVFYDDTVRVQAGAGIVYNSIPELEYQECRHKAGAMIQAITESLRNTAKDPVDGFFAIGSE